MNGCGLAGAAQRSACWLRINGRLNLGLIHTRSRFPNKYAHGWLEINSLLSLALFSYSTQNNRVYIYILLFFFFLSLHAEVDIEGTEYTPVEADSVDSISDGEEEEEDHYSLQSSSSDTSYTATTHSHRLQPRHC